MRNNFKSFLLINPFGIGDVLFSTPLITNIKENFPEAQIFFLGNKKTYPVLRNHPLIKKTFVYERDDFIELKKTSLISWLKKWMELIRQIRKENIDVCLDLSLNTQYGAIAWAAGIKKRFGLDYKKRALFLTKKIPLEGFLDKHVALYYLDVLKLFNIEPKTEKIEVFTDKESDMWAEDFLKNNGINKPGLLIGIAPAGGASWGMQGNLLRWPEERFASLIKLIKQKYDCPVIIFGSDNEKDICDRISLSLKDNLINAAGKTTLTQFVSLLKKCSIAVCNDAGPLHIAVGLGIKTVCICGPVDELVYAQFPIDSRNIVVKKEIPCRPCYNRFRLTPCQEQRKCLEDISPEEVFRAVEKLI
jgi:lipopolysaccharide heptosyltransferase II